MLNTQVSNRNGEAIEEINSCARSVREVERNEEVPCGTVSPSIYIVKQTEQSKPAYTPNPGYSHRAVVLAALTGATSWCSSHDLVKQTGLTYPQVVFALFALHNFGQIARTGRKFTARWGPLTMIEAPAHNFDILQGLFHGIVKRPGLADGDDAEKGSAAFSATPALSNCPRTSTL